jgi:two-component system nitrate/nitrite response regulator NarL
MNLNDDDDDDSGTILRVAIADDHKLLADAVSSMLGGDEGFETSCCYDLESLLKLLGRDKFDIVLLDLRMPGMSGLDSVAQVVRAARDGHVVLFTGQVDRHVLDKAIELGVRGLIAKTMPLRSLGSIIELICSGQIFVPVGADFPGSMTDVENKHGFMSCGAPRME